MAPDLKKNVEVLRLVPQEKVGPTNLFSGTGPMGAEMPVPRSQRVVLPLCF